MIRLLPPDTPHRCAMPFLFNEPELDRTCGRPAVVEIVNDENDARYPNYRFLCPACYAIERDDDDPTLAELRANVAKAVTR